MKSVTGGLGGLVLAYYRKSEVVWEIVGSEEVGGTILVVAVAVWHRVRCLLTLARLTEEGRREELWVTGKGIVQHE